MKDADEPITFIVEGRGEFPMDMLRREHAWPTDTESALTIPAEGKRRVSVTAQMMRYVTPARWASFGWNVVEGFHLVQDTIWLPAEIEDRRVGVLESA